MIRHRTLSLTYTCAGLFWLSAAGMTPASMPGETEVPAPAVESPIQHSSPRPVPMAVMNYETFEATVDHGDLAECPAAMAREDRFCRAVLHGDSLHVFAFSHDFDQPLQAVIAYPLDEISFPQ